MEGMSSGFSKWFYLGIIAIIFGLILIFRAKGVNKSKAMENGYFFFILGWVGVISEWTDFATVLFIFVVVSGAVLLIDKISRPKGYAGAKPHYVYYAREFFPLVLAVFVLRAFLFEAYQIPSSSMRPDLTVGDFILVNKFDYGIREPITNRVLIPIHEVKRGDVIVFKDQTVHNRDLIKRVVGVGGDKIEYYNKRLTINGQALDYTSDGTYDYLDSLGQMNQFDFHNQEYVENLTGVKHKIITWDQVPTLFRSQVMDQFPSGYRENCTYRGDDGFTCTVPHGYYFVMGDNRDNSLDSRYWGFVPNQAILGRAFYVWMNFHDFSRIGTKI
jgi:signal peptidase I